MFFSKVDYIQEFVLIGGEPLLYEKLPQVIEYIGSKYRNQINIIFFYYFQWYNITIKRTD